MDYANPIFTILLLGSAVAALVYLVLCIISLVKTNSMGKMVVPMLVSTVSAFHFAFLAFLFRPFPGASEAAISFSILLFPPVVPLLIVGGIRRKKGNRGRWACGLGIIFAVSSMLLMFVGCIGCNHDWLPATCTDPMTCSKCEQTQGEELGHIPGEWEIDRSGLGSATALVWVRQYCETCGEEMEAELKSVALHNNGRFLLSPNEFAERLDSVLDILNPGVYNTEIVNLDDGTMACGLRKYGEPLAAIMFTNSNGYINDEESRDVSGIWVGFYEDMDSDGEGVIDAMIGVAIMCDPLLEPADASAVLKEVVAAAVYNEPYYHNGIGYAMGEENGSPRLVIMVE